MRLGFLSELRFLQVFGDGGSFSEPIRTHLVIFKTGGRPARAWAVQGFASFATGEQVPLVHMHTSGLWVARRGSATCSSKPEGNVLKAQEHGGTLELVLRCTGALFAPGGVAAVSACWSR